MSSNSKTEDVMLHPVRYTAHLWWGRLRDECEQWGNNDLTGKTEET
jgi:hypothetical protein